MGRLLIATFGDSKPFGSRVNVYQTTRCYNPEDSILHIHRRENLKSYLVNLYGEATHRYVRRFETLRIKSNFYQTTRCYNPEDSNLHTHRRENLKSYLSKLTFYSSKLLPVQPSTANIIANISIYVCAIITIYNGRKMLERLYMISSSLFSCKFISYVLCFLVNSFNYNC
jgi:hypothetical protein